MKVSEYDFIDIRNDDKLSGRFFHVVLIAFFPKGCLLCVVVMQFHNVILEYKKVVYFFLFGGEIRGKAPKLTNNLGPWARFKFATRH